MRRPERICLHPLHQLEVLGDEGEVETFAPDVEILVLGDTVEVEGLEEQVGLEDAIHGKMDDKTDEPFREKEEQPLRLCAYHSAAF